jgi:ankyrin repeat protein
VRLLLKKGAKVDFKNRNGLTLLLFTAYNGHKAVMRLLLKKGAKVDSRDKDS